MRIASSVAKPDGEAMIVKISSPTRDVLSAVIVMDLAAKIGVTIERYSIRAVSKPTAFTKYILYLLGRHQNRA